MEHILKTELLTKLYNNVRAVDNVNMSIPKGAIYGFVGRNGSGKTTLLRIVTDIIQKTSGDFSLYGQKTRKGRAMARKRVAAVVETPSIYLNLTAEENLKMQCKLLGIGYDVVDETLKAVNLVNTGRKKAKNFSLGMKQRLGIAIALIGSPDFLILDEPTNGLDPEGIIEIRELLLRLSNERQLTILISSHILSELSKIATHYGFISQGSLVKELSAFELEQMFRKRAKLIVSSTANIAVVLEEFYSASEYKILSETSLEIYADVPVTRLVLALVERDITLLRITENNEDLESFYIGLIGGRENA